MTYYVKTKAKAKPKPDFVSLKKGRLEPYGKEHKNSKTSFDVAWEFLVAFQQSR